MAKKVIISEGQTLFDLALQYYGDVSFALDIVKLNDNIPHLLFNNLTGLEIEVDEIVNTIVNFYNTNNIKISTRYPELTTSSEFSDAFSDAFNN